MPTFSSSEQFITSIKLRELRKQRELLLQAYNQLDKKLLQADSPARQLQILYRDLRQITFAGQKLHPDVANLEPVLYGIESGAIAAPDTVGFWHAQLEKELAGGRLRSEIVFIFAALLEEWTKAASLSQEAEQERQAHLNHLVAEATDSAPNPALDSAFLSELFGKLGLGSSATQEMFQQKINAHLSQRISSHEVRVALHKISGDRYQAAAARKAARSLLLNEQLLKEFSEALTLMLKDLANWRWAADGVEAQAGLTPSKWRLFLQEDLPDACLVEILGYRWQEIFDMFFNDLHTQRWQSFRKTSNNLPPVEKLQQALYFWQQAFGIKPTGYAERDIWSDSDTVTEDAIWEAPASIEPKVKQKLVLDEMLGRWLSAHSIYGKRAGLGFQYRDLSKLDVYGSGHKDRTDREIDTTMEQTLNQVNAEIKLTQAVYPGRPIYILKADLKNYYPALSHDLILDLLSRFGLNAEQLTFFQHFLQVPLKTQPDNAVKVSQRGLPNHRRISDLLGEQVLLLLDYFVKQSARVQIIRIIDDICIIAPSREEAAKAWAALETFCQACGLELNQTKCGGVCLGGDDLPPTVPQTAPNWALLVLDKQGDWRVEPQRFENYLTQARRQVQQATSLIAKVEAYNNSLNYLTKALSLGLALGKTHRESVNQALLRYQHDFFGDNQGMVGALNQLIRERFLEGNPLLDLPDGWLHWPITAGGMSLAHPLATAMSYDENFRQAVDFQPPEERPADWQRKTNLWFAYYQDLLRPVFPSVPTSNQVMETLVEDFIQRGAELSVTGQESLSVYWRWIVYLYGPQIRDRLGTFRFLITELVPTQLIMQKYRQDLDNVNDADADVADDGWGTSQIPF